MLKHVFWFPSFSRLHNIPLWVYTSFCLSIHPSMDTGIASTFLAIVNNTTMNMVYKCVLVPAFNFGGYVFRRGIAGSYNSMFNFLRNCHVVFHSHYTILHSYQQCTKALICPHSHRHILFSVFKNNNHPSGYEVVISCGFDLHSSSRFSISKSLKRSLQVIVSNGSKVSELEATRINA